MLRRWTVICCVPIVALCCLGPASAITVDANGALDEWLKVGGLTNANGGHGEYDSSYTGTLYNDPWEGNVADWEPTGFNNDLDPDPVDIAVYRRNGYTEDDAVHNLAWNGSGYNVSGGEFYDIEALYLDFEWSGATITKVSWALVTSWNGDPNAVTPWYSIGGAHFQPFIAIDLGIHGDDLGTVPYSDPDLADWDLGLRLADDGISYTAAGGLRGTVTSEGIGYTPRLYDTQGVSWTKAPHPNGYKYGPYAFSGGTEKTGTTSASYFGKAYTGDLGYDDTGKQAYVEEANYRDQIPGWPDPHWQSNNWAWEGYIDGLSITGADVDMPWKAFYSLHCANDHTWDYITTSPPNVPEPASIGLLALAITGIAGAMKRRRKR